MFFRTKYNTTLIDWIVHRATGTRANRCVVQKLMNDVFLFTMFSVHPVHYMLAYYTFSLYSLFYFYYTAPYNSPPSDWTRYQRFRRDIKMSWSRMLNPIKVIENIKRKLLLYIAQRGAFIEPKKINVYIFFLNAVNPQYFVRDFRKLFLSISDRVNIMHIIKISCTYICIIK